MDVFYKKTEIIINGFDGTTYRLRQPGLARLRLRAPHGNETGRCGRFRTRSRSTNRGGRRILVIVPYHRVEISDHEARHLVRCDLAVDVEQAQVHTHCEQGFVGFRHAARNVAVEVLYKRGVDHLYAPIPRSRLQAQFRV